MVFGLGCLQSPSVGLCFKLYAQVNLLCFSVSVYGFKNRTSDLKPEVFGHLQLFFPSIACLKVDDSITSMLDRIEKSQPRLFWLVFFKFWLFRASGADRTHCFCKRMSHHSNMQIPGTMRSSRKTLSIGFASPPDTYELRF